MDKLVFIVTTMIEKGNYLGLVVLLGLLVMFLALCCGFRLVILAAARYTCKQFLVYKSGYFLELGLIYGVSSPLIYGRYKSLLTNIDEVGVLETLARYSALKNSIEQGSVNYD